MLPKKRLPRKPTGPGFLGGLRSSEVLARIVWITQKSQRADGSRLFARHSANPGSRATPGGAPPLPSPPLPYQPVPIPPPPPSLPSPFPHFLLSLFLLFPGGRASPVNQSRGSIRSAKSGDPSSVEFRGRRGAGGICSPTSPGA